MKEMFYCSDTALVRISSGYGPDWAARKTAVSFKA